MKREGDKGREIDLKGREMKKKVRGEGIGEKKGDRGREEGKKEGEEEEERKKIILGRGEGRAGRGDVGKER